MAPVGDEPDVRHRHAGELAVFSGERSEIVRSTESLNGVPAQFLSSNSFAMTTRGPTSGRPGTRNG